MSNPIIDTFDAMWTHLNADETVTSLLGNGTKFAWTGGLLQRYDIEPAHCPILSLGPAGGFDLPHDHHQGEPKWPFLLEIATDGQDCRDGMQLLFAAVRCLRTEVASDRLGLDTLSYLSFGSGRMDPHETKHGAAPLWVAQVTVTAHFRPDTDFDAAHS